MIAWISNYIHHIQCDQIPYPFEKNEYRFVPLFTEHVIIYLFWDLGKSVCKSVKGPEEYVSSTIALH